MSLIAEHRATNASNDAPVSSRDEFSLDGLPVGTGADLVAVGERAGALKRV